ncbi:MAG: hypothetical protein ACPL7J_13220 [Desulfomonilaceae bacterium]
MENKKQWWMSKTIWTNLIALVGSVVLALGVDADQWAEIAAVSLAVVNLGLRLATKDAIELPAQQQ